MTANGAEPERTIDLAQLFAQHRPTAVKNLRLVCGLSLAMRDIVDDDWRTTLDLIGEALDCAYDAQFEGPSGG